MRLQLLSDLHLETEEFEPQAAPEAELLVLCGDIDSTWKGLARFEHWPVPVLMVAGNHEFDRRDLEDAWPALRECCARFGIRLLERESTVMADASGQRIRFVGTVRWCDFDLLGPAQRERAMRAGSYFTRVMGTKRRGLAFDAVAVRQEAMECREWLHGELARPKGDWHSTVVVTHFAPSACSADPRYGLQPTTASFCNADEALLPHAQLWIHGHLHCRHDYMAAHANGHTRVVCNARGHAHKGEAQGYDGLFVVEI